MNIDTYIALEAGLLSTQDVLVFYAEVVLSGDIWLLSDEHLDRAGMLLNNGALQFVVPQNTLN